MDQFGGTWTETKLDILKSYLDAYTTALKNQHFDLLYIDAFAGSGSLELKMHGPDQTIWHSSRNGSARIAMDIVDKPFDELIFIEQDEGQCARLQSLKRSRPSRKIIIENTDANAYLQNLERNWQKWRGVLFLDPFGTQVDWDTLKEIAGCKALDIWILFPTFAVARMLPTSNIPDEINPQWTNTLNRVYGDESWRDLYQESPQRELFDGPKTVRQQGVTNLINIYKGRLRGLFKRRLLEKSIELKNSKNSKLYEFIFCVGSDSDRAIGTAKRIAKHLLNLSRMGTS